MRLDERYQVVYQRDFKGEVLDQLHSAVRAIAKRGHGKDRDRNIAHLQLRLHDDALAFARQRLLIPIFIRQHW